MRPWLLLAAGGVLQPSNAGTGDDWLCDSRSASVAVLGHMFIFAMQIGKPAAGEHPGRFA